MMNLRKIKNLILVFNLLGISMVLTVHPMMMMAPKAPEKIMVLEAFRLEPLRALAALCPSVHHSMEHVNLFDDVCEAQQEVVRQELTTAFCDTPNIDRLILGKIAAIFKVCSDIKTMIAKLNLLTDKVFGNARNARYAVEPEVLAQVKDSIAMLEKTTNSEEFIFHLAIVEHLLADVHDKTPIEKGPAAFDKGSMPENLPMPFNDTPDLVDLSGENKVVAKGMRAQPTIKNDTEPSNTKPEDKNPSTPSTKSTAKEFFDIYDNYWPNWCKNINNFGAMRAQIIKEYVTRQYPKAQSEQVYEALIAHAKFICDATIGGLYLRPQESNARIDASWDTIRELSPIFE